MRRLIAALSLVAVLLAAPVGAQTQLVAGYPDRLARGPAAAAGAVIYSHGLASDTEAAGESPFVVDALQEGGWDVFRLQRQRAGDTLESATAALTGAMQRLRGQGYERLVLVGHSFGAWISLAVARPENGPVDAVIALAPAAFGRRDEAEIWPHNAAALYPLVEAVAAKRIVVFLFEGDAYEPGGRGDALREIFQRRELNAAVVERPFGLMGHEAGLTRGFASRFGPCIRDFIDNPYPAPVLACLDPLPGPGEFALPPDLQTRPAGPDDEPGLVAMTGRWYGAYENGREVMLALEETAQDSARAVYAFSPIMRRQGDRAGYTRRRGVYDKATGVLRFAESQAGSIIECKLIAADKMALAFAGRDGGSVLYAVLRRLD
jgi:dienelactone hydrolase